MPVLDPERLIEERVSAIRSFHERVGTQKAELDISGGIDSAVMLGLLARALGPENITAAHSAINSDPVALARSQESADAFGVRLIALDLNVAYTSMIEEMRRGLRDAGFDMDEIEARIERDPMVLGSIRSTLRAPVGRGLNRMTGGGIRHGTGNECEDRWLRFYQKGGDGEVDSNPIAMLAKGEVYQLARAVGVPQATIDAMPTPDLWGKGDNHNDEDELFAATGVRWTYSRIDFRTGEYTVVGTIERLARFLDKVKESRLFGDVEPDWDAITREADRYFPGTNETDRQAFLQSARRMEAISRHKMNPNCPTLGDRESLVESGVLTNELPNLS